LRLPQLVLGKTPNGIDALAFNVGVERLLLCGAGGYRCLWVANS